MSLDAPEPDIERIFDQPGLAWSPAERAAIMTWLNVQPQLPYLLRLTAAHLGAGTTAEDAEDVWQEFCAGDLGRKIDYYDPDRGMRFVSFLRMCLKQVCWKAGHRVRRRNNATEFLDDNEPQDQPEAAGPLATRETAEASILRDEAGDRVQTALAALPEIFREVIVLKYFEDHSVSEMAQALGLGESNVKVRLHRARRRLRRSLE